MNDNVHTNALFTGSTTASPLKCGLGVYNICCHYVSLALILTQPVLLLLLSFVLIWLLYCRHFCILQSFSVSGKSPLQNAVVHTVVKARKYIRITPILMSLHRLTHIHVNIINSSKLHIIFYNILFSVCLSVCLSVSASHCRFKTRLFHTSFHL